MCGELKDFVSRELETAVSLGGIEGAVVLLGRVNERIEQMVQKALADSGGLQVACGPGCPHCCVLAVSVLIPETVAIADYLRCNGRLQMASSLREFVARTEWMEDSERAWRGLLCPFLDSEGSCSIYPVRPLLCRSVTSTDPEACRASLVADGEGGSTTVVMSLMQKELYQAAFISFAECLEARGMDSKSVELVHGVLDALARLDKGKITSPGDSAL